MRIHVVILQTGVIYLIVLTRVSDVIIVLESLCIKTYLCLYIDDSITVLSLLCGDHDDTVGTARTVKGI